MEQIYGVSDSAQSRWKRPKCAYRIYMRINCNSRRRLTATALPSIRGHSGFVARMVARKKASAAPVAFSFFHFCLLQLGLLPLSNPLNALRSLPLLHHLDFECHIESESQPRDHWPYKSPFGTMTICAHSATRKLLRFGLSLKELALEGVQNAPAFAC